MEPKPLLVTLRLPLSPGGDLKASAKTGVQRCEQHSDDDRVPTHLKLGTRYPSPCTQVLLGPPRPQPSQPYPGCGQDPQGKETGSKQVPESMPVKLQSHGQQHSPQQVQHLEKEVSRGWAGMERHLAMPPGEIGKWISSRLWLWLSPRAHSALTCLTTGCKRAMAMTVTHTDIKEPRKSQNCSTS